jgi:hypothetical protein
VSTTPPENGGSEGGRHRASFRDCRLATDLLRGLQDTNIEISRSQVCRLDVHSDKSGSDVRDTIGVVGLRHCCQINTM